MSKPLVARPAGLDFRLKQLSAERLSRLGYASLLALCLALPFELTQRPILQSPAITLTDLSALTYVVGALAILTVWRAWLDARWQLRSLPVLLFGALLIVSAASGLHSTHRAEGLKWTFDLFLGGVIWQVIPIWLGDDPVRRMRGVGLVLVIGAAVSALIGLLEVLVGPSLDAGILASFKAKPTVVGPYLRLSGTFDYANTAAGFFATVLPFALANALAGTGCITGDVRDAAGNNSAALSSIPLPVQSQPRCFGLVGAPTHVRPTVAVFARGVTTAIPYRALLSLAALVAIVAALALTFSRGAWLGAGTGLFVAAAATRRRWMRFRPTALQLVSGAIAVLLVGVGGLVVLRQTGPGTLRLTTQSDLEWYQESVRGGLPPVVRPNAVLSVRVTVSNPGPLTWRAGGAAPFHLSYHWLLPDDRIVVLDGLRTALPHDLRPGATERVRARVLTPRHPGAYRLAWDIVEENVAWFSLHTGRLDARTVDVKGKGGGATVRQTLQKPPIPFPTAAQQPERAVLWAAAIRIIRAHPLLGIGPNAYRLSYGLYERPPQSTWDTRIYANSLPLEIAADLGILGALLFFGMILLAVGPALIRVLFHGRTDLWTAAIVAAPVVLLAHGAVDYLLGSRAVMLLFWIALGLVAALPVASASPLRTDTTARIETEPRK